MRIITLLIISILFSSCLTPNRIKRNCDLFAAICGSGTTTEIKYRDTTIYVDRSVSIPLQKDTAKLTGTIEINSQGGQMDPVESKEGLITIRTSVKNSKLTSMGFINQDSIIRHIKDSLVLKNAIRESDSKTSIIIKEKYIPKFYKFAFWVFIGELIVIVGFLVLKFLKINLTVFSR